MTCDDEQVDSQFLPELAGTNEFNTKGSPYSLRVSGLRQVLHDSVTGDRFELHVERDLIIPRGSFVAIHGPSGCGKTTLLTVIGLLRCCTPDSELQRFEMWFRHSDRPLDLRDIWKEGRQRQAMRIRRRHLGFALQTGELISSLNVAENIATPLQINGESRRACRNRVLTLLDAFGISGLENRRLKNLSLGQYQRVALARAIAHDPELIFVDEPTASLNRETARAALQELKVLTEGHSTVMMITHEEDLAREFCDLIIELEPVSGHPAGRVKSFFRNPAPRRIDDGRH
jgi:ABC-type lipoprotein export system ATPase subunit